MIAMRYMFRDKIDRVEDLNKAMETLERLKEKEIAVYGDRERDNLNQAMQARKARKELEALLYEFDNTIDILEALK